MPALRIVFPLVLAVLVVLLLATDSDVIAALLGLALAGMALFVVVPEMQARGADAMWIWVVRVVAAFLVVVNVIALFV